MNATKVSSAVILWKPIISVSSFFVTSVAFLFFIIIVACVLSLSLTDKVNDIVDTSGKSIFFKSLYDSLSDLAILILPSPKVFS